MANMQIIGGPGNFTFRTNPNTFKWNYTLRTKVEPTYGGRVIQLLGIDFGTVTVEIEAGRGGLSYVRNVVLYFRDLLLWQRDRAESVALWYPPRNYGVFVMAKSVSFSDEITNVTRPVTLTFAIDSDINGILTSQFIHADLAALQEGIGYVKSVYNDPQFGAGGGTSGTSVPPQSGGGGGGRPPSFT